MMIGKEIPAEQNKSSRRGNQVRLLAEAVVMIALSSVLHIIRIYTLPEGGSVTLGSMIPILLLSLRRGLKVGATAGAVLGLVVLYEEPFIYNPIQVLLDYPIAFGALGLAGLLKREPIAGVGLGVLGRFFAHFLSGIVFFASFAPAGINPALYSAIYNGSYLGIEFGISAGMMYLLMKRRILEIYL